MNLENNKTFEVRNVFGKDRFFFRLLKKIEESILKRNITEVNNCDSIILNVSKYPMTEVERVNLYLQSKGFISSIQIDEGKFTKRVNQYKETDFMYDRVLLVLKYPPQEIVTFPDADVYENVREGESRPFYKGPDI